MVKWKIPEYETNGESNLFQVDDIKEIAAVQDQTVDGALEELGYGLFQFKLTLLAGFIWMSDSFEIALLSMIGQFMSCEWQIMQWHVVLLTSVALAGMVIGCMLFGKTADVFGRRTALIGSAIFIFVFGVTSSGAPSYYWLLAFRAVVGLALGAIPQVLTYCCEYFPAPSRGRSDFFLSYFWGVGGILFYLAAWGVMVSIDNWRVVVALSAVPSFIAIVALKWFPESIRYHLLVNEPKEANQCLKEMSQGNRKVKFGQLKSIPNCANLGSISELLSPAFRAPILIFWFMGAATSFCYYGMIHLSPSIIKSGDVLQMQTVNNTGEVFVKYLTNPIVCMNMTQQYYIDFIWVRATELPGLLVFTMLVDLIDRKKLMFTSSVFSGIFIFLLLIKTPIKLFPESFLFVVRALLVSQYLLIMIMVTEAFPTTLRGTALGTSSAWYKFSALTTPFISQFLVVWSPVAGICIFSVATLSAGVSCIFLPMETRRKQLVDINFEQTEKIPESTSF